MIRSVWIPSVVLGLVALQRLVELQRSRRNERLLHQRGAYELGSQHFPWMKVLHGSWLVSTLVEAWLRRAAFPGRLEVMGAVLFICGLFLRYVAIETLGDRWTARVLVLPGQAPVERGIYRFLTHPNYWGVALELVGLPLAFGATLTAAVFSILNLWLMTVRLNVESTALRTMAAQDGFKWRLRREPS